MACGDPSFAIYGINRLIIYDNNPPVITLSGYPILSITKSQKWAFNHIKALQLICQ
jgi:hypothetical protein